MQDKYQLTVQAVKKVPLCTFSSTRVDQPLRPPSKSPKLEATGDTFGAKDGTNSRLIISNLKPLIGEMYAKRQ